MAQLSDNIYNSRLRADEPKLKVWKYAGLMLTYKCNAACEFCYYNCSPVGGGLMSVDTGINIWESLKRLAGSGAKVHITGGEPFLYFDRLAELMSRAGELKLGPVNSIETNGFWATDRQKTEERLRFLDRMGMERLKISWDPFHAEFVNVETVRLLADTACEILGRDRVLVRWSKYLQEPVKMSGLKEQERNSRYISALKDYPSRFTGRAAGRLAGLVATVDCESFRDADCGKTFLSAGGVHIDPYGNIFSGLCSGIILGNVNTVPLDKVWDEFDPRKPDFLGTLFRKGPYGLMAEVVESGYQGRTLYAGKCHLCSLIRQFFFDNGKYKSIIGPCDCYSRGSG